MTRPEVDVTIGATASPAGGAAGATSDVFDDAARGEVSVRLKKKLKS